MKNITPMDLAVMNFQLKQLDRELDDFFKAGAKREFTLEMNNKIQRYCDLKETVDEMKKLKVITEDGKKLTGVVISAEDTERWERERIEKIAASCTPGQIEALKAAALDVINNPVDVSDYVKRASTIATFCTLLWQEVSDKAGPNMFHNYRKNLSPDIYGRPEHFRGTCENLVKDLRAVLEVYDHEKNAVPLACDVPGWGKEGG